ncbi:MAG: rhomboid family intramembrane serine protease [Saprospiraceae bacterium]|nr:rhomboid family intramembrane serine protease [Saprospiraceae bacterium]
MLNIIIFLYQSSLTPEGLTIFLDHFSTIPLYIGEGHHLGTLLSSMFLHGSIVHLLGNMMFLWVFADNIEATIGNFTFVLFYLAGGVLASLAHVYFNLGSDVPSLGASGAISAVLGAYLIMFPRSRIKVIVFLIIFVRQISMTALAFLGLWIVLQVVGTVQSSSTLEGSGVAWFAHLGGLGFGLVMGFVFKRQALLMSISS